MILGVPFVTHFTFTPHIKKHQRVLFSAPHSEGTFRCEGGCETRKLSRNPLPTVLSLAPSCSIMLARSGSPTSPVPRRNGSSGCTQYRPEHFNWLPANDINISPEHIVRNALCVRLSFFNMQAKLVREGLTKITERRALRLEQSNHFYPGPCATRKI